MNCWGCLFFTCITHFARFVGLRESRPLWIYCVLSSKTQICISGDKCVRRKIWPRTRVHVDECVFHTQKPYRNACLYLSRYSLTRLFAMPLLHSSFISLVQLHAKRPSQFHMCFYTQHCPETRFDLSVRSIFGLSAPLDHASLKLLFFAVAQL